MFAFARTFKDKSEFKLCLDGYKLPTTRRERGTLFFRKYSLMIEGLIERNIVSISKTPAVHRERAFPKLMTVYFLSLKSFDMLETQSSPLGRRTE